MIRLALAAGLVALLVLHAVEGWDVRIDAVSLGLLVLLVLTIVGFDRIEEIAAPGGLSVKLRGLESQARSAAETLWLESPDEPPPRDAHLPLSEALIALAENLRGKLAEIHTYFFDKDSPGVPYGSPDAGYVLARLRKENLLTPQEAAVADRLLDLAREALQGRDLPADKIWPAMHYVGTALHKIRSTVFRRMVESEVREAGWAVEELPEGAGKATEFLARRDDFTVRVAALSVKLQKSDWLANVIDRLGSTQGARLIVIPPRSLALEPAQKRIEERGPGLHIAPFNEVKGTLKAIFEEPHRAGDAASSPPDAL